MERRALIGVVRRRVPAKRWRGSPVGLSPRNASDGATVLWEARLLDPTQPFTTYVNDMGTPVAP